MGTTGAREASFRNIKTIAECLADEVITPPRARPTAMPSRRRTRSSALPRATVKQPPPRLSSFLSHPVSSTCGEVEHRHKTRVLRRNKLQFAPKKKKKKKKKFLGVPPLL